MNLTRPLVFLDIESATANENQPDPQRDRIIEIAGIKYSAQFGLADTEPLSLHGCFNPGIPILPKCAEVHGWTDERVASLRPFTDGAQKWHEFIGNADIGGFGVWGYDIPLLVAEFERAGLSFCWRSRKVFDAGMIMRKKEERTLTSAARFYCNCEHEGAHGAVEDTAMAIQVFKAQLQRYPDLLKMSLEELHKFCQFDDAERLTLDGSIVKGPDGDPVYTHKRVRGVKVKDDLGYASWMLHKADFPRDTREWLLGYMQELSGQWDKRTSSSERHDQDDMFV